MPTLTLRIEENSPEHIALEKIKQLFGDKTNTSAIERALFYMAKYEEHKKKRDNSIEVIRGYESELGQLKQFLRKKKEIEDKLNDYLYRDAMIDLENEY